MALLANVLEQVIQRTGRTTGNLQTRSERILFQDAVRKDIAAVSDQLNSVYSPLVTTLVQVAGLDALEVGLAGNVIYTDLNATANSAGAYWDSGNVRKRSIKETVDVLLAEISRIENSVAASAASPYDDAPILAGLATDVLNLTQLRKDTMGTGYSFDSDGAADLTYPLAEVLDAVGSLFTGYVATGIAHGGTFPALSFTVLLSNVTLDTTIPQATITDLTAHLGFIRSFMGKSVVGAETPTYSAHGALNIVSDGDDLELAVWKLDNVTRAFITTANVTSNSPGTLATDDFVFGSDDLEFSITANNGRFFFDKSKASFAAGWFSSGQQDPAFIGSYNAMFGYECEAFGDNSLVAGRWCYTNKDNSVATGAGAKGKNNGTVSHSPFLGSGWDHQITEALWNCRTVNAVPVEMFLDVLATERFDLEGSIISFDLDVLASEFGGGGDKYHAKISGTCSTSALLDVPLHIVYLADDAAWGVAVTIVGGNLVLTATGSGVKNVGWAVQGRIHEMLFTGVITS